MHLPFMALLDAHLYSTVSLGLPFAVIDLGSTVSPRHYFTYSIDATSRV